MSARNNAAWSYRDGSSLDIRKNRAARLHLYSVSGTHPLLYRTLNR
jgi:hypothetical protein